MPIRLWNNTNLKDKAIYAFSVIMLTAIIFSVAIIPINSLDFWWHLKTGEYIIETREIPEQDPFTYTAPTGRSESSNFSRFILKQYWLSQILFASIVNSFGFKGIIIFRGLLFSTIAMCILLVVRLVSDAHAPLIPLILFALSTKIGVEDSDRPHMFLFLLSILIILICEWAIKRKSGRLFFLNIPILILASNMHGGYIVGVGYLLIYVICSNFEDRLRPFRRPLFISSACGTALTYLNPNHWSIANHLSGFALENRSMEFNSPVHILPYIKSDPSWLAYWLLVVLSIPTIFFLFKRQRYTWGILLLGVLSACLWSMRYIFFFVPLSTIFISCYLQKIVYAKVKFIRVIELLAIACIVILLVIRPLHKNTVGIKSILYGMTFPVSAAEFMDNEQLPQPVFNHMQYGGYLEWKLWPKYKMFTDTRYLFPSVYFEYLNIINFTMQGKQYLDKYQIASVITPATDPLSGRIFPLVSGLYQDPNWAVIYIDGQSIIFARKGLYSKELPKHYVYQEVLYENLYWQPIYPWLKKTYAETRAEALSILEGVASKR